ncbi:MAG TPA: c(7)-type cytochrome triheme domain-containing protein [Dissulfurispiraceae bacterium]|nr:c(7)-type cytochrome triheme domain-containing protein [Dissulfurispiraceae bacterium]
MASGLKALVEGARNFVVTNPKLTVIVIISLIAFFTFVSIEALHFTSDPRFCQYCHPNKGTGPLTEFYTWKMSTHAAAGVECLDCHGDPGVIGYMKAKMGGLNDVYGEFLKSPEHKLSVLKEAADPAYAAKLVPNDTCLFCHSDSVNAKTRNNTWMSVGVHFRIIDGAVNPGFRKSHNLPDVLTENVKSDANIDPHHPKHIERGINCIDCHLNVAHSGQAKNKTKMQTCFDCHDKMRARKMNPPANDNCMACHKKNEGMVPQASISFGKDDAAVKFEHTTHVAMNGCSDCHPTLFPMKKEEIKIVFADHAAGKECFSCHNGKKAFAYTDCTNCHAKAPYPKAPIVYKPSGAAPVAFSHDFHTQAFECSKCHTAIWPMKKGAKKMTMDPMYQGKFCGVCHNEKAAFAATDCDKCHKEPKK